ncbi:hypothetical protein [Planosporangium mesophilum]|uniref:DUF3060 domain-containing protein n=1 Tax=Planosporangium mesophilum TaxID=689768 RepID=A0A8J3TAM0_9ACTN|nr:hypothetical protein [Planosporangium mesophilum]NJC84169.1 hypothetical protein [Planosporangium mesophilum]GII22824.1 hypothetical protein Pme01_24210 [Planosporangium mesophilum]
MGAPRTVTALLVPLLAGALVGGCSSGGGGTPSPGASSGGGSSVPPSASPAVSSTPAPELTLSGQVEAGVEPNCLVLHSGGQTYNLMGGDRNVVKPGNNVVVRGHVAQNVMSYCMQGQPFQVTEASAG